MSERSTVDIDQNLFAMIGLRVVFDSDKYQALQEEIRTDSAPEPPAITIAPNRPWLNSSQGGVRALGAHIGARLMRSWTDLAVPAEYDPNKNTIRIAARRDALIANRHLLHETWHWANADGGKVNPRRGQALKAALAAGVIGAPAAMMAEGLPAGPSILSGVAILGVGAEAMYRKLYKDTPHEVRARDFESNPDILQRYSDILTYESLNT